MIKRKPTKVKTPIFFILGGVFGVLVLCLGIVVRFTQTYQNEVYPGIFAGNVNLSGKTSQEIQQTFASYNKQFENTSLTISVNEQVATISADKLNLGINGDLASTQAFSVGRTGNFLSDMFFKIRSLIFQITNQHEPIVLLPKVVTYHTESVDEILQNLASYVVIEPVEPLFEINKSTNKVTNFKLGKDGQQLDVEANRELVKNILEAEALGMTKNTAISVSLSTIVVSPKVRFNEASNLGITTLLGKGESFYHGSIKERIHNLSLAASIIHGKLVAPGDMFSFNDTVGDISAVTGYKSAYIIKNGRTILGDGGGVCQVSTTLFRAALNTGLPIVERAAHSYRVSYYEGGGYKPGLDATVYSPSPDLKFTNDTPNYILIQLINEPNLEKLTFELYGTSDGRKAEVGNIKVYSQTAPPPPLYQDDPTLRNGVVKQVEHAAWGMKTSLDYTVTRNGETLIQKTFYSTFQPWQAVFLRGTKI